MPTKLTLNTNPWEQTSKDNPQQHLSLTDAQSAKRKIMPVAKDGNCLINSLILSYLEKEKNNKDNFILKAKRLFPKLPYDIKNYQELFNKFKTLQQNNSKLNNLGSILRKQLADHINKNFDASYFPKKDKHDTRNPEQRKKDYLEKLKQNSTWCEEIEIKTFCEIFDCPISVETEYNNEKYIFYFGEKKDSTTDSPLELHFNSTWPEHYSYFVTELNHFNNPSYEEEPKNTDDSLLELLTPIFPTQNQDKTFMLPSTSNGTNQAALDDHRQGATVSTETLTSFRKQKQQIQEKPRLKNEKETFDSFEQILELG